ncbi:MAG TPA: hypothetical protein PKN88_09140, partial [Bacillota bacterium]|nr:hypothetical protein [Bacillota bacterium]
MRRILPGVLYAALIISLSSSAFANSGPTYWQGYPSAGMMAVDGNCPISVVGEDLVFDFSGW